MAYANLLSAASCSRIIIKAMLFLFGEVKIAKINIAIRLREKCFPQKINIIYGNAWIPKVCNGEKNHLSIPEWNAFASMPINGKFVAEHKQIKKNSWENQYLPKKCVLKSTLKHCRRVISFYYNECRTQFQC